jgi:putative PIN family toxin of toxin-antitoxin system
VTKLRVVLDTNVFVSALLSHSPTSPTQELFQRWEADEFTLLISDALLDEVTEKLDVHGISQGRIIELLTLINRLAERVVVPDEAVTPVIEADPTDDLIWACAVLGKADYLVSYDAHFDVLGGEYRGIKITKALPFLWAVREDSPSEEPNAT